MKSDRDIDKMVSRMGFRRGAKQEVVQYAKGMQDGMRMAYLAVIRRLLAEGTGEEEIRRLMWPLMDRGDLKKLLAEAAEKT